VFRIANRIMRKAQPVIEKVAREKSLGGVLYLTQVAWADPGMRITDQVVKAYNAAYPITVPGLKK
jgi:Skp family chaperone for outer membrane proteins